MDSEDTQSTASTTETKPPDGPPEARWQKMAADHAQRAVKKAMTEINGNISALLERMGAFESGLQGLQTKPADKSEDGGDAKWKTELEKRDAEIRKLAANIQEREAREAQTLAEKRDADARSSLVTELGKLGVRPTMVESAIAYLYESRAQRVRYNEAGELVYPVKRDWGVDELPVSAGLAEWAKSDVGKEYLAPVDTGGSGGSRVKGTSGQANGQVDKAAFASFLFGGGNE